MEDPIDDEAYWDLCVAEIDKVERQKTAHVVAASGANSGNNAAGEALPVQGLQSLPPERSGHSQHQSNLAAKHENASHQQQVNLPPNAPGYPHQRPMMIQPVVAPRAGFQQVQSARGQAPGGQSAAPRHPLQPVQAQQNVPLAGTPPQAKRVVPEGFRTEVRQNQQSNPMEQVGQAQNGQAGQSGLQNGSHVHALPVPDRMQQEMWRLQEELRQKVDAIIEKDGAISVLRSRMQSIEKESFELRQRTAGASASSQQAPSRQTTDMQREIERLKAQLLFKDEEAQEAKRGRAERDERLREAHEAKLRLEAELRTAQQQQPPRGSPGSAAKRPREPDAGGFSPTGPLALNQQLNRLTGETGSTHGRSPRALFKSPGQGRPRRDSAGERVSGKVSEKVSERASERASEKASERVTERVIERVSEPAGERHQSAQRPSQESERGGGVTPLATSTAVSSGAVTSAQFDVTSSEPGPSGATLTGTGKGERSASLNRSGEISGARETGLKAGGAANPLADPPSNPLRTIERFDRVATRLREAGSGACFVQKLFAVASGDLFTLVSRGGKADREPQSAGAKPGVARLLRALAKPAGPEAMDVDVADERQAFRDAFVKVVNGHKPVMTLLGPLCEAVKSREPATLFSSLRVLRILLRLDPAARSVVLGPFAAPPPEPGWLPSCLQHSSCPTHAQHGASQPTPDFVSIISGCREPQLSSRVKIGPASKAAAAAAAADGTPNGKAAMEIRTDASDMVARVASGSAATASGRVGAALDQALFDRLLEVAAIESEQPRARFEAASMLALLVAHVPAALRGECAFLLTTGGRLRTMLGSESPPAVRGVATHILHLLCESRPLAALLFGDVDSDGVAGAVPDGVTGRVTDAVTGGVTDEGTKPVRNRRSHRVSEKVFGKRPEAGPSTSEPSESGHEAELSDAARGLFAAVAECLGPETTDPVLKHSAVQLLSFVHTLSVRAAGLLVGLGVKTPGADTGGDVGDSETSIVARLLDVLDGELRAEGEESDGSDERLALRTEACSLLSRLVLHGTHADNALRSILVSSRRTRLAITVTTRVVKLAESGSGKVHRDSAVVMRRVQRRLLDNMPAQYEQPG